MLEFIQGSVSLIVMVLVFVAVLLLFECLYLVWAAYKGPEARKIEKRLRQLTVSSETQRQTSLLKQGMLSDLPAIDRLLRRVPRAQRLEHFIAQAGLDWTVSGLLLSCLAAGAVGSVLLVTLAHQAVLTGAVVGVGLAVLPLLYVNHKRHRRLARFEQQLPEALDLVVRALRSGHAFSSALQMIGDEMTDPVAGEFRIVHDEINFGVSLQQALTSLTERVPLTDLRYFVVSVLIQRESGGNLTEVLGNLSRLIRERLKLLTKVRILSSEGRLSAWILGLMPFALAGIMNLVNPGFMSPLWTDPIGLAIVKYMLILMVIGILILKKIVKIRV